jgi:hypothetical protein
LYAVTEGSAAPGHLDAFIRLVRATYGETYRPTWIYDRQSIMARIAQNDIKLVLVFRKSPTHGQPDLLGSAMLNFCYPSRQLVSCGGLMTSPSVNSSQSGPVLRLITDTIGEMALRLAREEGLRAMTVNAVTRHTLTQRLIKMIGFTTTGLLPGLVPANEEIVENPALDRTMASAGRRVGATARKRLSEIIAVRPIRSMTEPYSIVVPTRLARQIDDVYRGLRLPVELLPAPPNGDIARDTRLPKTAVHEDISEPDRRIARVEVVAPGRDSVQRLRDHASEWSRSRAWDTQIVILPFCEQIDALVESLLGEGFVFGAVYPKYRRACDALVLQRVDRDSYYLAPGQVYDAIAQRLYVELCG